MPWALKPHGCLPPGLLPALLLRPRSGVTGAQPLPGARFRQSLSGKRCGFQGHELCISGEPWFLGPWPLLKHPPPQLMLREGAMRDTTVSMLPCKAQTQKKWSRGWGRHQGWELLGRVVGTERSEGCGGEVRQGSEQAGRPGGGRQRIPLPRRETRSSGN